MLHYAEQTAPKNIETHYTPKPLAEYLVSLVPIRTNETVLDPCAGKNLAFYSAFPGKRKKCEIEDGTDFLTSRAKYDWAITNPPYHLLWKFIEKASGEATTGFAFLVNINGINTLTPKRLALLKERGFSMRRLHVCNVKQWFGRYYFYVFMKQAGDCKLTYSTESWK